MNLKSEKFFTFETGGSILWSYWMVKEHMIFIDLGKGM